MTLNISCSNNIITIKYYHFAILLNFYKIMQAPGTSRLKMREVQSNSTSISVAALIFDE